MAASVRRTQLAHGRNVDQDRWPEESIPRANGCLGQTADFLLTARRDVTAARRYFERATDLHDLPEKVTVDKSGGKTAAIESIHADSGADIEMSQSKYLNKRIVRSMLEFKNFRCARALIAGIETMHMIKKWQLDAIKDQVSSAANNFYSLAF